MKSDDRGATLVEVAIIMPLLLILIMGMVDVGRALAAQITLQDAVSEGALFGSQNPDDYGEVRTRVIDAADVPLAAEDITVTCPDPKTLSVSATYEVEMVTFVGQWFGANITLEPDAVGTVVTSATCEPSA